MTSSNELPASDPLHGLPLLAIIGPTAVGKSALALAVAERAGAEIVSLDSMQVYRGMDIGTAKASATDQRRVRHHMIDLVEPSERYDVQRFLRDLAPVAQDLRARGVRALFVGGTGFYLKVLLAGLFDGPAVDLAVRAQIEERGRALGPQGLHEELARVDPISAARLHPNDAKRVVRALEVYEQTRTPLSAWQSQWSSASPVAANARFVGLAVDVHELDRRIALRTRSMLTAGWPAEADRIRSSGGFGPSAVQALGYAEALALHDGALTFEDAAHTIALHTRQFARRQRTWYRKFDVRWFPAVPASDSTTNAERAEPGHPSDELVGAVLGALGW